MAPKGFDTAACHAGHDPKQCWTGAVVTPITTASTFKQSGPNESSGFVYGRTGNPTRSALETCLAAVEGSRYALTFGSGMGAIATTTQLLSSGDHLLSSEDVYGGTIRYFRTVLIRMGVEITYVDMTDISNIKPKLQKNTKMVWFESPTNPLCKILNIPELIAAVRSQPGVTVVMDNTFLGPYFQRPLEMGVDIVMNSVTKYLNGHSDVLMGSIATNNEDFYKRLQYLQNASGMISSPFDCYLVNRSLRTLSLRMERHKASSLRVAEWLTKQSPVVDVMHPSLPTHRQHELAKRQSSGHSGVFSFRHKGGKEETKAFVTSLQIFTLAESLGGHESIVGIPCLMSHAMIPEDIKQKLGITDNLIRLSVGLENYEDLIADLELGFRNAFK